MKRISSSLIGVAISIFLVLPVFAAQETSEVASKSPWAMIGVIALVVGLGIIYGYFTMKNKSDKDK